MLGILCLVSTEGISKIFRDSFGTFLNFTVFKVQVFFSGGTVCLFQPINKEIVSEFSKLLLSESDVQVLGVLCYPAVLNLDLYLSSLSLSNWSPLFFSYKSLLGSLYFNWLSYFCSNGDN